jgi:hypothetical protein
MSDGPAAGQRSTELMAAQAYTPDVGIDTLTRGDARPARRVAPVSWGMLAIVTTLGGLSAVYVALTPAADQTPLNGRTWQQFATTDPEVASIVARLLVVLGLLGVGFAAVAALVSLFAYRSGARWAWFSLWLVPLVYGAIAARQLADAYAVGYFYASLAAVAVVALVISIRRFIST